MPQFTGSILKEDSLGRVETLTGPGGEVLRRVACGGRIPGSGLLARKLLGRERRALERLQGLPGFPQLENSDWALGVPGPDGRIPRPKDVLLRVFVRGQPLHLAETLPANFFDRLLELMGHMHARGVCHNDLHKEQNIVVDERGYPCLIDFQLASLHQGDSRGFQVRCHEDRRHLEKHRRRYLRDGRGPQGDQGEWVEPQRLPRKPLSLVWRKTGKPLYHFLTRKVLRRWDGEERRESSGPWPQWTDPIGAWDRD